MKSTQFLVRVLMVLVLALPSVYAADGDNLPGAQAPGMTRAGTPVRGAINILTLIKTLTIINVARFRQREQ